MIVEKIQKYLAENGKTIDEGLRYEVEKMAGWVFKRQFMTDDDAVTKGTIRLSSVGRCPRQVAYAFHGFEKAGKELDQRAKIVFWMGDLVEMTVVNLAKLAGCNLVGTGMNQLSIKMPVNGSMISGHPDGVLFEDKQQFLLEVKSMSSYSFERFLKGDIDKSYIDQINAYMESLGLMRCVFVAINKDSGVMSEMIIDKTQETIDRIRENIKTILHSTPESLPEPPKEYDKNLDGIYPWQCAYCSFWKHCRTNAEYVLVKNSKKLKEKTNGDSVRGTDASSGEGNQQVGAGIREVQAAIGTPGRSQENGSVRANASVSRRPGVEGRGKGKNVRSVQAAS